MTSADQKVQVWKLERADHPGAYLAVDASGVDGVLDEIRLGELGDKFTITVEEWDRADLDALREWDGW